MDKIVIAIIIIIIVIAILLMPGRYIVDQYDLCPEYGSCNDTILNYAMAFWLGVALLVVLFYSMYSIGKRRQEEARAEFEKRRAEDARRAAEIAQHQRRQEDLKLTLERSGDDALYAYSRIPPALLATEEILDRAQREFEDGAFSPFWAAIEAALHELAKAESEVQLIESSALSYSDAVKEYEGQAEKFPVNIKSVARLRLANGTQQRMAHIIREAQKNFQFATIFEQRRTTTVLIRGFNTLAQAIEGLGDRIVWSIETLSAQVQALEEGFSQRHTELLSTLGDVIQGIHTLADEASEQRGVIEDARARDAERQLGMLDNIQRGRRPLESERGPRPL